MADCDSSNGIPKCFDKIINFRDVGLHVNSIADRKLLKPGLLYRSARLDAMTDSDRDKLKHDFKIKSVVDLRTTTEHADAGTHTHGFVPSNLWRQPAHRKGYCLPGVQYEEINFNGSSYSNALIKQLTWSQTAKLFSLYTIGYKKEAISVLGTNVMAKRGLAGLAEDSLEHCTKELKQVFDVLAQPENYPLIVHCTQGKDRTGLVVLLVLLLLRVPVDVIERDYCLSQSELLPEREAKLKEIRSIGLPDSFADCPPGWVGTVTTWLKTRYHGVEGYLKHCNITTGQQNSVRNILSAS